MKNNLLILTVILSPFNAWSSPQREPTPNALPAGICSFKTNAFTLPTTNIRISHVEVFTVRRGTGCLNGQTHSFWNKCDIRKNETSEGADPSVQVLLKFRNNDTLKNAGQITFPMTEITQLGWITDRKGNPQSITETTNAKNIEIEGVNLHVVAKRYIQDIKQDKILTEVSFYLPATEEGKKSKFLYQARCKSSFSNKDF